MGYESRIYVVDKHDFGTYDDGKNYAEILAMFDMCKCYPLSNVLRDKPKTDCYIYADDHNTRIVEDRYGEELTEATIKEVIDILENEVAKGEDYRRIFPLLSALKSIEELQNDGKFGDNVVVLHYGY